MPIIYYIYRRRGDVCLKNELRITGGGQDRNGTTSNASNENKGVSFSGCRNSFCEAARGVSQVTSQDTVIGLGADSVDLLHRDTKLHCSLNHG